jgi:lipopolysaccharide biosynthesis glycosyltransferase
MINILFLAFGSNQENHYQANLSILSFLRQKESIGSITLFTDRPGYYKRYSSHITLITIDEATLKTWRGEYDFFWRIKLKALEMIIQQFPGQAVAYFDSDTFLDMDVSPLVKHLVSGNAFMHENEGALSTLKTKTEKKMWKQVNGKTFGGVTVTKEHTMWNAGAVIFPMTKGAETIDLAIKICDDMCSANVTRRLIEQFALSVALQINYVLKPANNFIIHYWGNKKEWNSSILTFFSKLHLQNASLQEEIESLKTENFSLLPARIYRRSIHRKLVCLVDKLFPKKKWVRNVNNKF